MVLLRKRGFGFVDIARLSLVDCSYAVMHLIPILTLKKNAEQSSKPPHTGMMRT